MHVTDLHLIIHFPECGIDCQSRENVASLLYLSLVVRDDHLRRIAEDY